MYQKILMRVLQQMDTVPIRQYSHCTVFVAGRSANEVFTYLIMNATYTLNRKIFMKQKIDKIHYYFHF